MSDIGDTREEIIKRSYGYLIVIRKKAECGWEFVSVRKAEKYDLYKYGILKYEEK